MTMKVKITHLKAPWPDGVVVGDVVELQADSIPPWALGKCVPAPDDAPQTRGMSPAWAAYDVAPDVAADISKKAKK